MRPLPTSPDPNPPTREETSATRVLELGAPAAANQRRVSCATQRAYPWLLGVSTAMAGVFCFLYLSKPVIVTESRSAGGRATASLPGIRQAPTRPDQTIVTPAADVLPGDESSHPKPTAPRDLAALGEATFEETNLRIQHVLGAQGPAAEDLGRIVLEVPVLYRSGTMRWTREDVAKARSLLTRLDDYQQKSRELRGEAETLIREWDDLIYVSIPESSLRADSPTLPDNQGIGTAGVAALNTTESIEIENR